MTNDNTVYTTPMEVRFADTDANGHVFFANYLTFFDTAFLKYLEHIDCGFDWFTQNGINFYYVEATAQYKAAVAFGDLLNVQVTVPRIGNTSFDTEFKAFVKGPENKLAATGRIVSVVVDNSSETPVEVPTRFRAAVGL